MVRVALVCMLAACSAEGGDDAASDDGGGDADGMVEQPTSTTYDFGPYEIAPGEEVEDDCVQITLGNAGFLYVNAVELTTGPGFHHSNWLHVPETTFEGPDGTFKCADRGFTEPGGAAVGGVIFAQSTQSPHEVQQFPAGVIVKVPPKSKLVAPIHLLNGGDTTISLAPTIKISSIPRADVTTQLAGISFQNQSLELPAGRASSFSVECDIDSYNRNITGEGISFNIYYALAHYHDLGTGLTLEAVKGDGTATTIYTTDSEVGDNLGGPIEPKFNMTGYEKLRLTCDFFNPRAEVVSWGNGDGEMCVFLAFSDSEYNWGGGVLDHRVAPQNPVDTADKISYSNPCTLIAAPSEH